MVRACVPRLNKAGFSTRYINVSEHSDVLILIMMSGTYVLLYHELPVMHSQIVLDVPVFRKKCSWFFSLIKMNFFRVRIIFIMCHIFFEISIITRKFYTVSLSSDPQVPRLKHMGT